MVYTSGTPSISDEFWLAIALTAIPGVLGGVTYGVSVFLKELKAPGQDWPPSGNLSKRAFFSAQALSGMGGSLAALLVTLWANRFPEPFYEIKAWLSLVCTGYVAGYVANRLLPAIAESLYNRIKQLSEKAEDAGVKADAAVGKADANSVKLEETQKAVTQASERVTAAEQRTKQAIRLSTEMVRASDYLAAGDFGQKSKTMAQIDTLSELATVFPTNRTLAFLLVRFYDEAAGDCPKAVSTLEAFIDAKKQHGEDGDADTADALWNLASYYVDGGQEAQDPAMQTKAVEALRRSLQIVPSYYSDLMQDEGFAALKGSSEGQEMLRKAKAAYESWLSTQQEKTQETPKVEKESPAG
jgi:hypothetical protein